MTLVYDQNEPPRTQEVREDNSTALLCSLIWQLKKITDVSKLHKFLFHLKNSSDIKPNEIFHVELNHHIQFQMEQIPSLQTSHHFILNTIFLWSTMSNL
jgi:hypothetical protein